MDVKSWLQQPTTIRGIGAVAGVLTGALAQALAHDQTITGAVGIAVYGIVHIVMPDNSGAPSSVEKLVTDAVSAVVQNRLAASMPLLISDAMNAASAIQSPTIADTGVKP